MFLSKHCSFLIPLLIVCLCWSNTRLVFSPCIGAASSCLQDLAGRAAVTRSSQPDCQFRFRSIAESVCAWFVLVRVLPQIVIIAPRTHTHSSIHHRESSSNLVLFFPSCTLVLLGEFFFVRANLKGLCLLHRESCSRNDDVLT